MNPSVMVADESHLHYASAICTMMAEAAKVRGTGIAKRQPEYIQKKIKAGQAVIALDDNKVVGFCYIESWEDKKYVANSGLIVHPNYRHSGLARAIKANTFKLSKLHYPHAKLFGITTSTAVMKINSDLGYKPVSFSELTQDQLFWDGCTSCINYDILTRTDKKLCLCTGMVCDLSQVPETINEKSKTKAWNSFKTFIKKRKERIQSKFKNSVKNEK